LESTKQELELRIKELEDTLVALETESEQQQVVTRSLREEADRHNEARMGLEEKLNTKQLHHKH
jgi:hypothetical protein